ncbi:hypothetical protein V6N13_017422 [Hibiscus sabdariffa]
MASWTGGCRWGFDGAKLRERFWDCENGWCLDEGWNGVGLGASVKGEGHSVETDVAVMEARWNKVVVLGVLGGCWRLEGL